jgi:hypothetical protein
MDLSKNVISKSLYQARAELCQTEDQSEAEFIFED